MNAIVFDPILPAPWLAIIGAALFAATIHTYLSVGTRLGWARNSLLAVCRLAAVSLVLLALLQPARREEMPMSRFSNVLLVGIDASRSMKQADAAHAATRLDSARSILRDSGLLAPREKTTVRFFQFDEDARPLAPNAVDAMKAEGTTTHLNQSLQTMLGSLQSGESAKGMVLLTDGHDLELTSPSKTAFAARARRVPIFAVPLGAQGLVRDASVSITNYQPYCFVKQRSHITGSIRVIGCEHENLTVQLLRQNHVVQTSQINVGEQAEVPVDFEVSESEPGQYEYEIRAVPLPQEADVKNNAALTFLNVIDQQIRVLLLEGEPYWDTGFLERSLFRNDKISLDAVLQYMPGKSRLIRKTPGAEGELRIPATKADFERYDVIILGRSVEKILRAEQLALLREYVRGHGGTVVFGRGKAYEPPDELDPVTWDDAADGDVTLQAGRGENSLPVFRTLGESAGGLDALPHLIGARKISDRKTLASILAEARDPASGAAVPAMIHRRFGRGQILSVAVEGLWRWSFYPKTTATNNAFDRFWDQLLVWLVAGGEFATSKQYAFRANTANLMLGESLHLRLTSRDAKKPAGDVPVTVFFDDKPILRTALTPAGDGGSVLHTEILPEKTGRYRAEATLPDGQPQVVKWMVYEDNPEEKEVAADVPYLKALCEGSGGRLVAPEEISRLVETLEKPAADLKPKVRTVSLWDRAWVFYLACFLLGADWYLRRKWGLC